MTGKPDSLTLPAPLAAPHLAGILGDGQSALAALLRHDGADVSGCDIGGKRGSEKQGTLCDHLAQLGIPVSAGHDPAHLPGAMTALVYSAAIAAGHAELDAARSLGLPVLRRHQALSLYASLFGQVLAVAGGAGKTSTSAVLAAILTATSWQPTVYLGARSPNLGDCNYRHGERRLLIAEADEYRNAFLDLPRHIGIIGPVVDYDHRDYFGPGRPVTESFTAFAAGLDLAVADADNLAALQAARAARTVISVGTSPDADYRITNIQPARGDWRIEDRHGHTVLDLHAPHCGPALHLNASRAAITALELGVSAQAIRDGISGYRGVSRRMELRHSRSGVLMLDDYAHNPAQITALARALRGYYPGRRLIAVFEPRQHRRTVMFTAEFGQSLAAFDACLLLPISSGLGDEHYGQHASLGTLADATVSNGQLQVATCASYDDAAEALTGMIRAGDIVVSFGTGSPYLVLDRVAAAASAAS
jgi:UDP-N-acetylmuramate--alanine ligase